MPSRLGRWLVASQLRGVREEESLAALSESERRGWTAFWAKVEETIDRGTHKTVSHPQSNEH